MRSQLKVGSLVRVVSTEKSFALHGEGDGMLAWVGKLATIEAIDMTDRAVHLVGCLMGGGLVHYTWHPDDLRPAKLYIRLPRTVRLSDRSYKESSDGLFRRII